MKGMGRGSAVARWFQGLMDEYYTDDERAAIKAVVVVSAHWEHKANTVGVYRVDGPNSLLFDYSGFPPHTYQLTYPAPGDPALADRILDLLDAHGLAGEAVSDRGLDHGVFVPLKLMLPEAELPVVQVSLLGSLDAEAHLELGEALAPLADEGVLIVGSGFVTHGSSKKAQTEAFEGWLTTTLSDECASADHRKAALIDWESAPFARRAHIREEHLLPVHVVAGAAGYIPAERIQDYVWNMGRSAGSMASYLFRRS